MKVIHAAETIKGGVATVINSLVEHQLGEKADIICLVPSDQRENLITLDNLKTETFNRNGRSLVGMLVFAIALFRLIKNEEPEIVHLHSSFAGLLGRLVIFFSGNRKNIKVIYCPHAFSFLMKTNKWKQQTYAFIERKLSLVSDKIICVSTEEYDSAIDYGIPKEKLVLIHNGVKVKNKLNHEKITNKNLKLLFVGRFDYQKGIDTLKNAIDILGSQHLNFSITLTLVGDYVNSEEKVEFHNYEQIQVKHLGWLSPHQLEQEYLTSNVLIIPSRWEGFAMVPLEAMSYGLPIIASDIKPFQEIINHQENGFLFEIDSPESLANQIELIDSIDLDEIKIQSLNLFKEKYTDTIMNIKTYKLYQ